MFTYPTIQEAAPSIAYLGGLIAAPSKWELSTGMQNLWTAQGYLQSVSIGGAAVHAADGPVTQDDLVAHCTALVQMANGGAVSLSFGRSGLLLKLVSALIGKAIESGLAEDVIKKLIGQFVGGLTPTPSA